jgi:hypothetical protein
MGCKVTEAKEPLSVAEANCKRPCPCEGVMVGFIPSPDSTVQPDVPFICLNTNPLGTESKFTS